MWLCSTGIAVACDRSRPCKICSAVRDGWGCPWPFWLLLILPMSLIADVPGMILVGWHRSLHRILSKFLTEIVFQHLFLWILVCMRTGRSGVLVTAWCFSRCSPSLGTRMGTRCNVPPRWGMTSGPPESLGLVQNGCWRRECHPCVLLGISCNRVDLFVGIGLTRPLLEFLERFLEKVAAS